MSLRRRGKPRKLALITLAVLVAGVLGVDVFFRVRDAQLKMGSLERLKMIGAMIDPHLAPDAHLLRVRDPRSGQQAEYVAMPTRERAVASPDTPVAWFPISAAQEHWWFDLYGYDTRGGAILFADGHAEWRPETAYHATMASGRIAD